MCQNQPLGVLDSSDVAQTCNFNQVAGPRGTVNCFVVTNPKLRGAGPSFVCCHGTFRVFFQRITPTFSDRIEHSAENDTMVYLLEIQCANTWCVATGHLLPVWLQQPKSQWLFCKSGRWALWHESYLRTSWTTCVQGVLAPLGSSAATATPCVASPLDAQALARGTAHAWRFWRINASRLRAFVCKPSSARASRPSGSSSSSSSRAPRFLFHSLARFVATLLQVFLTSSLWSLPRKTLCRKACWSIFRDWSTALWGPE